MKKRELRRALADAEGYARALREQNSELENELAEERSISQEQAIQDAEGSITTRYRAPSMSNFATPLSWMEAEAPPPQTDRRIGPGDVVYITDREGGSLVRVEVEALVLHGVHGQPIEVVINPRPGRAP